MKEASGELSMTVIVIVGAVLLIGLVRIVIMPMVETYINESFVNITKQTP